MPPEARSTSAEAYAVARRLHQVTEGARQAFSRIAAEHELSPPQARLILRLFEAVPMKELAEHLACDASNVTGIASRLSERGLVTTTPGVDRRVKLLGLTALGRQLRLSLEEGIASTAPALTRLTKAEREVLIGLLDKLIPMEEMGEGRRQL